MKNNPKYFSSTIKKVNWWTVWIVIPLLIFQGNELKAIHTIHDKPTASASISPCEVWGPDAYNKNLMAFKKLKLKEKREFTKGKRHLLDEYKSRCPEQYELLKKQRSLIFWTDAWHVGLAIVLFPVAILVAIVALVIFLLLKTSEDVE